MPPLTASQEGEYTARFKGISEANALLAAFVEDQGQTLHRARENREDESLVKALADFVLHSAPIVVELLLDGPGWVFAIVHVGITAYDTYRNLNDLSQDDRMNHLGFQLLTRAGDDATTIYFNTTSAILGIQEGGPAKTLPRAEIQRISDFSVVQTRLFRRHERAAWSEVTVRNLGEDVSFRLFTKYWVDPDRTVIRSIPVVMEAFSTSDAGEQYIIPIAEDQSRTLKVTYHDDRRNATPEEGQLVYYCLLAYDGLNTYLLDDERRFFSPVAPPVAAESMIAQTQNEQESPIISDDMVISRVIPDENSLGFEMMITVSNPCPCPVSPTVTQQLPEGLQIRDAVEGSVEGSCASWCIAIPPHTSEELLLEVERTAPPEQEMLIPGARVEVYDPSTGETVVFASRDISVPPVMPLRAEVSCPVELVPRYTGNFLCRARNLLPDELTAELLTKITSTSGTDSAAQRHPLTLGGMQERDFIVPIVADISPGEYVLDISLAWGTLEERLYNGWLVVLPDEDDDGMPSGWEVLHGLDPLRGDASEDRDGDRFPNYTEYITQTDPADATSFPRPAIIVADPTALTWELRWEAAPGRIYELQWSEDGVDWHTAKGERALQVGRSGVLTFSDDGLSTAGSLAEAPGAAAVQRRFYRVGVFLR